jgi:mannose-6-phosphate isomerase-like protein (cupin superfamily)
MRAVITAGLLLLGCGSWVVDEARAQTPPVPAPAPKPAQPPAPARRPPAPAARGGLAITVTDPQGATLGGVRVEVVGASDRTGETNASGQINFPGMQAGTYRLRFSGERVITFEKEIALRAGQVMDVDVTLHAAPPPAPSPAPPAPPPAPAPAVAPAPVVGPAGMPRTLSIVGLLEKELIPGNQPRRETLVSCSGNTRTTLVQLNQDQPDRLYDTAEVTYYIVAGEGAVRIAGRDTAVAAGGFVSVPRGTAHGLVRRGRRPLIVLTTLSGAPCEEPR